MPFFCYNKDDYCDHSENCDGCDVWVKGKGGKEVPSNGDRIRSMTDEELADFIENVANRGMEFEAACQSKKECEEILDRDEQIPDEWCRRCRVAWLQQPAEEVDK